MASYLVFVYGTLKRGEPNHHYMNKATFITGAKSVDKFPLVIASKYNIPFLLDKPGLGHVKFHLLLNYSFTADFLSSPFQNIYGEIYNVNEEVLAELDILEAHPELYTREERDFHAEDGSIIRAWIYVFKKFSESLLELEFYESYDSEGSHGKKYVPGYDRTEPVERKNLKEM